MILAYIIFFITTIYCFSPLHLVKLKQMVQVELERKDDGFAFEAIDSSGLTIKMDAGKNFGGNNFGISPMQSLLMALGGCSGIDVVSILQKQRQTISSFKIVVNGNREEGVEPSLWTSVDVQFLLIGAIDFEKAKRACSLSIDKYCSVAETLRRSGCTISWDVKVNELP